MSEMISIVPEKDGKPTKCSFNDGVLTACWPLETALEPPYGRGTKTQGLKRVSLINAETWKFCREAVSLISGEFKTGVQFSFCPFCAAILHPTVAKKVTVTIAARSGSSS